MEETPTLKEIAFGHLERELAVTPFATFDELRTGRLRAGERFSIGCRRSNTTGSRTKNR
jgi:hypothetical protein